MTENELPYVVVLDVAYSGYGVLRSLAAYKIPLIGFSGSKKSPENYTGLCRKKIYFKNTAELLDQLVLLPDKLDKRPVLILTTDNYVEFYIQYRQVLESKYLIHMPDNKTVDLLIDKNKFAVFANENNILIPKSFEVKDAADLLKIKSLIKFPVILKPYKRTLEWEASSFKKAYILSDYTALLKMYETVSETEKFVIVQEYIEGNDDHIEYCLAYFSNKGACMMSFTGQKIRQWPVGTGSTATTIPVNNPFIKAETERIFKAIHYCGFGSIEFKKDANNGKYYLMEPTVGRLNQQEYVATLSGFNIPLIAYTTLTGIDIKPKENIASDIVYIDELAELQSVYIHFKRKLLTFSQWLKSLKGNRHYRYFNKHDMRVFFVGLSIKAMYKFLHSIKAFLNGI